METIWKEFEERLKGHDWFYYYSDDHSVYLRGQNADYRLVMMFNELSEVDEKRATELWNAHCPGWRKRELHLF